MSTNSESEGCRVGSHGVNATVSLRFHTMAIYAFAILAWFLFVGQAAAQKRSDDLAPSAAGKTSSHRAVTVADAIAMTRFLSFGEGGLASKDDAALFSPDGSRFLILVERGNLEKNTRVYSLFLVRSDAAFQSLKPHLLVSFSSSSNRPGIQDVKWLDNRWIAFMGERPNEQQQLYAINCVTEQLTKLTKHRTSLNSYAITANRERVFYTAHRKAESFFDVKNKRQAVVVSNQPLSDLLVGEYRYRSKVINQLFSKRRQDEHEVQIKTKEELIGESLWLSPNGRYVVVRTSVEEIPDSWKAYQYEDALQQFVTRGRHVKGVFTNIYQYELIDADSGKSEFLIDAPLAYGDLDLIWASDSSAIVISGTYLPLDVPDVAERKRRQSTNFIVEVKIPSREIVPITSKNLRLLKWDSGAGKLLGRDLEAPSGKLFEYQKNSADWREIEVDEAVPTNGAHIEVTVDESINTPPRLFAKNINTGQKALLVDPNPQFGNFEFGQVEEVSFKASDGRQVKAGLYRPADYVAGRRYPLVIQTHGWDPERFWMDGPFSTAYAARPLADKGFVVLQVDDEDWKKLGTSQEVHEAVAVYEGGIDYLDGLRLVDRARVGIIGFSRSGLFVEYALTHSNYHFTAATLADISDAGYFRYLALLNLSSEAALDSEGINGGVPFGDGLASWVKNSPGFNLDKVAAPIRMEADNPMSLLFEWEWFAGLSRLTKPVDLIYMPDGSHALVKPWERMTSQQGDVDWFCFWLRGEEDPDPAKADQYARWRDLRTAHEQENDNKALYDPRP
jgi:dipeptidyl aminopeptidase/acylaminoacyl peptidase